MPVIGWLFEATPGPPSFWYLILVAIFAVLFVGSLLVYLFRRSLFPGHSLHVRLAGRFAAIGIALGAVGLVLLAARYLGVPFLSLRFWLVLAVLATLGFAGYLVYFFRMRYPAQLVAYQAEEARRRYVKPIRATGGTRRRSKRSRR